jgi:shikimate kinase
MKKMLFCSKNIFKMLYLLGFMGVGKTTIAEHLSAKYNINFIDTDNEIRKITNKSISENFKKYGENNFRELERKILKSISKNNIVSCGGGLPIYKDNMKFIKKSGVSIYLKSSEDEIFFRLAQNIGDRPLIQNKSPKELRFFIKETLSKREIFYKMADYTIEIDHQSRESVLRKINSLSISI